MHLELTTFAYQIACGLEHLALNGVRHRDVAARNMLLSKDKKIVKVADLGMGLSEEDYLDHNAHRPLRWTAAEALRSCNAFTEASDV